MLQGILFLIALMPFGFIIERRIRKKYNIEREWGFNFVNKIDKFGTIAIFVIVSISYFIILFKTGMRAPNGGTPFLMQFMLAMSLLLAIFQTIMQWKYNKEAKRYVLDFMGIVFSLIALVGITFIFPWT